MTDLEYAKSVIADWKKEEKIVTTFMGINIEEFDKEELIAMIGHLNETNQTMYKMHVDDINFLCELHRGGK